MPTLRKNKKSILVVGGAGYIGSHMVQKILEAGKLPVALDNLSTGHRELVPEGVPLEVGEMGNPIFLQNVFRRHSVDSVMHFAARSLVGESVAQPRAYWRNNLADTLTLLDVMKENSVQNFVFSSSCSVYGEPQTETLTENHQRMPVTPYGHTKKSVEDILESCSKAEGLRYITLRYFNAAGADPNGNRGERHQPETHLIPNLLSACLPKGKPLHIHGNDYPTPDGTAIRDYVHVLDLADAHLQALRLLQNGVSGEAYNLGTGKGYSVLEVLRAAEKVIGQAIPFTFGARRAGDPTRLVASAQKAKKDLNWRPRFNLNDILTHSWNWQQNAHAVIAKVS